MSRYDALLIEAKKKGEGTAADYIPRLYDLLIEEKKTGDDARKIVEQDLIDIWSRATIRRYLPEEAKDENKVKAGKKSAESKKQTVAVTTGGESLLQSNSTEDDSNESEKPNSKTFETPSFQVGEQNKPEVVWKPDEKDTEVLRQKLNDALIYIKKLEAINKTQSEIKPEADKHDCSNHSMYLKAQAIIENERKEKEQYKQRVEEFDKITFVPASEAPNPPELFQIPKDIDITKGQYHESLSPIQALGKIRQLLNAVTSLEIGWRIIE